jgi:two-component system, NtrC family, sensor histidine kinase HydH
VISSRWRLSPISVIAAGLILLTTGVGVAGALVGNASTVVRLAPYLRLAVGTLLAVAVAITIEVVVRRERYAARVAAERTAELEASREALVRSERLSAVGQMAAVIGHELRNPLAAALNAIYLSRHCAGGSLGDESDAHLALAERQVQRAAALSEDLTSYMRERKPTYVHLRLDRIVDEVLATAPPPTGVTVVTPRSDVTVDADQEQMTQVLVNLLTNAYQAMPGGGSLSVAGTNVNGHTEIVFQDTGDGIPAEIEGRIFEPFVSTKATGTGLGLAIVKRIVEGHEGTVDVRSAPGAGTRVVLRLPRHLATV